MNRVGAIVIGRNEAHNLRRCLDSVAGRAAPIVYVDTWSEDGSVALARSMGAEIVELDRSVPFSVARARNEGFARLSQVAEQVEFVQFVDADSEMIGSWFDRGRAALADQPKLAVVCGQLRERFPEHSRYDRLYAIDWDPRLGEPDVCGGMAMMRATALREMKGFDPRLTGLEDHELCFRMRRAGWHIRRLDAEMAVHEADMTHFHQWWAREVHAGLSWASVAALHRRSQQRYAVRECRSNWFWGLVLPAVALIPGWPTGGGSLLLLAGYPALFLRIYWRMRWRGLSSDAAGLYAGARVIGKFPQLLGQLRFHLHRA